MRSPAQYQHDVAEFQSEEIKTDGLSEAETRQSLEKIAQLQEKLRQVENSLNLDLHALRSQYQGRSAALNIQNQKKSGKARMDEEQRLEDERTAKLAPYEEIKNQIVSLLESLEKTRMELERAVPGAMQK